MYTSGGEDVVEATNSSTTQNHASNSILNSLSLLRNKINQVESLISIIISPDHQNQQQQQQQPLESTSITIASIGAIIQEIFVTASSVMFTCQQMIAGGSNSNSNPTPTNHELHQPQLQQLGNYMEQDQREQGFFSGAEMYNWYGDSYNENDRAMNVISTTNKMKKREEITLYHQGEDNNNRSNKNFDIIELDAAYILAKYTHYCQVCGKGFKRDANLRMHMRAHGDEYKTNAALSNPLKNSGISTGIIGDNNNNNNNNEELSSSSTMKLPRKYSCPQEGCRWNQRHAKFQPLKSMICVKNHYKRSHCPKMYVCKRCNRKQFSVLSDLRTHEKHCGDLKWQCSCGTTFSRKDKLLGHVTLFIGHTPAFTSFTNPEKSGESSNPIQLQDRHLRNRDAVVRSRERKEMYVRGLEIKSRHLEGECRRLGHLFQCFIAENQALHLRFAEGQCIWCYLDQAGVCCARGV